MSMKMGNLVFHALLGIILITVSWQTKAIDSRNCFSFPEDIQIEKDVTTDTSRWKNQCREGTMISGIWSQKPKAIMQDMKCCSGSVDHNLSMMMFDLHYESNGSTSIDQIWNAQCPDNHAMTGVKVTGSNAEKHLAGIKCSALINKKINLQECFLVDFANMYGVMRDPSISWSVECPAKTTLVALYDNNHFKTLLYGKCCKIQDVKVLNNLQLDCPVSQISQCGWTISRDTSLSWGYFSSNGGNVHYLYLTQTASSGTARIISPGYSAVQNQLCFRLNYMLRLYAAIRIYMKSTDSSKKVSFTEEIGYLTKSTMSLMQKDFIIEPKGNFQIIVEGERLRITASTVMITDFAFVKMTDCNVDRCKSPSTGCAANEVCLPTGLQGFKTCVCKRGYTRMNGVCSNQASTSRATPIFVSTARVTNIPATTGGQHRSGDGKSDGGGEKKPDKDGSSDSGGGEATGSKKTAKSFQNHSVSFNPWVYTAVGAVCGTLLVMFLLFAFLAYRKRRLHNHRYRFDFDVNYLRPRSFSGSVISENNNSYVPEPTVQITCSEIVSLADKIESNVPSIENSDENQSIFSSTPPSHHYFELEQECDLNRKSSQATLTFPLYGSSEDVSEEYHDGEKFLEPPSDEQELCAQLNKEIDIRELDILPDKQLGQGAFGYVHYGIWHKCNCESKVVAIKSMKDSSSSEERIKFFQEAAIMKQFAHQNVVLLFGVVTKRYPPMIVLEYMQNGNLRKYLSRERRSRKKRSLSCIDRDLHRTFLRMAREIVAGMTYLAGMQFVHRDLAARNILLDKDMVCKIGDFGLARDLIGCQHYISHGGRIPVKWTAPEALAYRRYSTASDVWSFGVLLYEIWSVGKKPYEELSNDEVIEKVGSGGYRLPPPKDCPRVIYHLMIDCWHPEEAKRPRFSQIKYCLAQNDVRLLGRGSEIRQRSVTASEMECDTIKEDTYGELQNSYCKTD